VKKGNKKGFSGLADLVSDVGQNGNDDKEKTDVISEKEEKQHSSASVEEKDNRKKETEKNSKARENGDSSTLNDASSESVAPEKPQKERKSAPAREPASSPTNNNSSGGIWFFVIAIFIVFIIAINSEDEPATSKPRVTKSEADYSGVKKQVTKEKLYKPAQTKNNVSADNNETKESVIQSQYEGQSLLSYSDLKKCLKQQISIETVSALANDVGVARYLNELIEDFDSRCAGSQYREDDKIRADKEIEMYRYQIVNAARQAAENRVLLKPRIEKKNASLATNDVRKNAEPSKELISQIQSQLTQLGYSPGPSDGIMGRRTAAAIRRYQRDFDRTENVTVTYALLNSLKEDAKNRSGQLAAIESKRKKEFKIRILPKYFTEGSNIDEVIRIQGDPDRIIEVSSYRKRLVYGIDSVVISSATNSVLAWNKNTGRLKVQSTIKSARERERVIGKYNNKVLDVAKALGCYSEGDSHLLSAQNNKEYYIVYCDNNKETRITCEKHTCL
jgi:hypothetical protein